jgi:hypothetical protein
MRRRETQTLVAAVLLALLGLLNPGTEAAAAAASAASASTGCTSDLDCRLNGKCVGGTCQCSAAWRGANCSTLNLQPTASSADLRQPGISTWGMGMVHANGEWHGYFAEMEKGCGLTSWQTNSLIVRDRFAVPLCVQGRLLSPRLLKLTLQHSRPAGCWHWC